jgi:hypothetical protein
VQHKLHRVGRSIAIRDATVLTARKAPAVAMAHGCDPSSVFEPLRNSVTIPVIGSTIASTAGIPSLNEGEKLCPHDRADVDRNGQ